LFKNCVSIAQHSSHPGSDPDDDQQLQEHVADHAHVRWYEEADG